MKRTVVMLWECSCPKETGDVPNVETKLTTYNKSYNPEENEHVVMTGYIERCSRCKKLLGDGYGDVDSFKTRKERNDFIDKLEPLLDKWI